jgi:hypothetical protein
MATFFNQYRAGKLAVTIWLCHPRDRWQTFIAKHAQCFAKTVKFKQAEH